MVLCELSSLEYLDGAALASHPTLGIFTALGRAPIYPQLADIDPLPADPGMLASIFKMRSMRIALKTVPFPYSPGTTNLAEELLCRILNLMPLLFADSLQTNEFSAPEGLRYQREAALRIAIRQLPGTPASSFLWLLTRSSYSLVDSWDLVSTVLSKAAYSPIAQRCALQLLFLAYVFSPNQHIRLPPLAYMRPDASDFDAQRIAAFPVHHPC